MEKLKVLEELFDEKLLAILKVVFNEKGELYLRETARKSGVPVATTFRLVKRLVDLGILKVKKVKNMKLYSLAENDKNDFLSGLLKKDVQILEVFVEQVKKVKGVEAVVLQGERKKDKANVLIIGDEINGAELKRITAEINKEYDFQINYLPLNMEQYQQMSEIGLYSGDKKVLFKR